MLRLLLTTLWIIALQGCVAIPDYDTSMKNIYNVPLSGSSQFDNSKHIRMGNMVCSNTDVMFELYQDTVKSKSGVVLLHAGKKSVTNIGNGKSLLIKLDGQTHEFESKDTLTEYETIQLNYGVTMKFSHKTYIVPESFVRKAATTKIFLARVHLLNNTYIEGKCSPVSVQEYKEIQNKQGLTYEVTQEGIDRANKYTAQVGFREFVQMMDSTKW